MKLRAATSADIPAMLELERSCPTSAHWLPEQYEGLFVADESGARRLVLVAERPDAHGLLAFLVARHVAPEWELENIVVTPAERRVGIGRQLIDALLAAARETDSEMVFLEVRESNSAARALYEKADFQQSGRRKSYYANPLEDAILYRRNLH